MPYSPVTDFLALVRNAGGQASIAEMPGLDYVVAAMARAGLFTLYVGQTAPTSNQSTTAWLRPASPSWTAEGTVWLWNGTTYAPATPLLWNALLDQEAVSAFQSVTTGSGIVAAGTALLAVQRAAPAVTLLSLPSVASRFGGSLQIVDWSTAVANHQVILVPAVGETIMQQAAFELLSTAYQLAGVTLYPSIDLSGWVIAP